MRTTVWRPLVGVVGSLVAMALVAGLQAQAPKLDGTWKLNVAKSKFSPGSAPKSVTITYTAAGDGMKIVVHQVPATGPDQHWEMTASYDGKDYPVKGNPNADTISLQKSEGLKSQSTFKKGGKVTAVNMRTLSADGKTLTIEVKGTDEKGQAVHNIQVFER
jgi:hypothetical protein